MNVEDTQRLYELREHLKASYLRDRAADAAVQKKRRLYFKFFGTTLLVVSLAFGVANIIWVATW